MVNVCSHFLAILKDYCLNSSLAGLSYVADRSFHYSERLFWLGCVILSWIGSFFLILNFMDTYTNNSVSMGVVSLRPTDEVAFPSAGICERGYLKENYEILEEMINELKEQGGYEDYNLDVEDFLMRAIFHNLYSLGTITSYCLPYFELEEEMSCPLTDYQRFADRVRANCTSLFDKCYWNKKEFNCCQYFKPVRTSLGTCYLINSIQAVKPHGPNWLDMMVGMMHDDGNLQLSVKKSSSLYILNEEEIPHVLLATLKFEQIPEGFDGELFLSIQDTKNDKNLRGINPEMRKCIFPDEPSNSAYRYYSYSTCVTECMKVAQIRRCNCTHFNYIVDERDKSPVCDYFGLSCLDKNNLLAPAMTVLQPWRSDGLGCTCLPSCNEPQINIVGRESIIRSDTNLRKISIKLQQLPSQRYFRQAVREQIDIVGEIIARHLIEDKTE